MQTSKFSSRHVSVVKHVMRLIAVLMMIACSLSAVAGCGSESRSSSGKLRVTVSINQWSSIAREIGGNQIELTTILTNPNIDAHDFEPQVRDVTALSTADVEVVNGAGYDSWATRSVRKSGEILVSAAQSAHVSVGQNPHLWFNARARRALARDYADALARLRPASGSYFRSRYARWCSREQKLEDRMKSVRDGLQSSGSTDYVATEAVAWYLAHDIGLKDITPTGYTHAIQNDSEPAPSDLARFRQILQTHQAHLLILNTQEENSMTSSLVAAAHNSGTPIVRLTESMPPRYSDLLEWMNALVTQFSHALEN
jgi:zinc/manganese transport system substrate-binding protein